jgi:hypothetical protein
MMSKRSINPREIIRLLSKLKSETPEYPAELLDARKAAFLKQAATLKIEGKGQGGEGGQEGGAGGAGGSGPALGGGTAAQGFLLQALVGFSVMAALLLTAFAYREQIGEILNNRNDLVAVAETGTTPVLSTPTAVATITQGLTVSPTAVTPTSTPTGVELINVEGITIIDGTLYIDGIPAITGTPDGTKPNPGLHLGQTPGTPAAPGQGNPGNQNQPNKPDRPDNPGNPGNSNNPGNPNKPE